MTHRPKNLQISIRPAEKIVDGSKVNENIASEAFSNKISEKIVREPSISTLCVQDKRVKIEKKSLAGRALSHAIVMLFIMCLTMGNIITLDH